MQVRTEGKSWTIKNSQRESNWETGVSMSHHDSNWEKDRKAAQKHLFKIHCRTTILKSKLHIDVRFQCAASKCTSPAPFWLDEGIKLTKL